MSFTDMHCHMELFDAPRELAQRCAEKHVRVLAVTASPRSWRKFTSMMEGIAGVRPALGIHPQLGERQQQDLRLFESLLEETRYVGEVGLDASSGFAATMPNQILVLRRVLRLASEHGEKVLSIHSVRAAREALDLLEAEFDFAKGRAILHWFTGSKEQCRRAVELGCYFSINGQMLRSERGRTLAREIPSARLLTETDGPFVLEQGRPATPLDIETVVAGLAKVRGETVAGVGASLAQNLRELVTPGQTGQLAD